MLVFAQLKLKLFMRIKQHYSIPSHVTPEQGLEVFWQLSSSSIAWVHGDEQAHRGREANLKTFKNKSFLLVMNCILNTLDLQYTYSRGM